MRWAPLALDMEMRFSVPERRIAFPGMPDQSESRVHDKFLPIRDAWHIIRQKKEERRMVYPELPTVRAPVLEWVPD